HTALRRCSPGCCRQRHAVPDATREAEDSKPAIPGIGVCLAPPTPALAPFLAVEQREAFLDVAVDLVELLRRVPPAEVVAPAPQHRVELLHHLVHGPFQPRPWRRDRFDLGPNGRHCPPCWPALAEPSIPLP